jgi:heme/copper-type cytochrome/quinol oxidase subunit 2
LNVAQGTAFASYLAASGTTKGTNAMNYMMTISIVALAVSGFAIVSVWKA